MSSRGGLVMAALLLATGCSYYNVIRNAEVLFVEAEAHRRAGRDSLSVTRYLDVVRKTGTAYRARPDAEWAEEALFLLGRARLRLGELRAADLAFDEASSRSAGSDLSSEILAYEGVLHRELGDRATALDHLNAALGSELSPRTAAVAHLTRGRLLLEQGDGDLGWWDLDRAAEYDPGVAVEAGVERLHWAVYHDDQPRAMSAALSLLDQGQAGIRFDTIAALVGWASERWGAEEAAALIAEADNAEWDRASRGRIQLERATLLELAGDTASAAAQAWLVAGGLGVSAADARLLISDWRAADARDLAQLYDIRSILLPAGADQRVARRLVAVDELEAFADAGLNDPLGLFAAAEVARDRIGADFVARGLFLAYADGSPDSPWVPKALLATIEITEGEGDRAWLRGRLEAYRDSPYVLAAHGGPAAGFEELEEELDVRLRELTRQ